MVQELWRSEYKVNKATASSTTGQSAEEQSLHVRLHNYKRLRLTAPSTDTDAFDQYLETDPVPDADDFDVFQYWYDRRHARPELAKFAFDTLATPLMSDDAERSFSAGRDLITYRRSNLLDELIEACSCLRNWYGKPKKDKTNEEPFDDEMVIEEQFKDVHGRSEPTEVVNELYEDN